MSDSAPRALVFAPYCFPPASAEAIVAAKLAMALSDAGWRLSIVTDSAGGAFYPAEAVGPFQRLEADVHDVRAWRPRSLDRVRRGAPAARRASRLRGLAWSVRAALKGLSILRQAPFDVVLSRSMPQYGHLPALLLQSRARLPWVAAWSDPLPPGQAPPPYGAGADATAGGLSMRYCQAVAQRADWHVFPSDRMRRYVGRYLPACAAKSSAIPHVAFTHTVAVTGTSRDKFVVCHAGGGLGLRKPDVFLRGFDQFVRAVEARARVGLRFIGARPDDVLSGEWAEKLGGVVTFDDRQPYEQTLRECARASVLLVLEAACAEGIFLPSKFVDYAQVGRPVLAVSPASGTLADLLGHHGGGLAADCLSAEAVAGALTTLFEHWRAGTLEAAFDTARLREQFSPAEVGAAYRDLAERLMARRQTPAAVGFPP